MNCDYCGNPCDLIINSYSPYDKEYECNNCPVLVEYFYAENKEISIIYFTSKPAGKVILLDFFNNETVLYWDVDEGFRRGNELLTYPSKILAIDSIPKDLTPSNFQEKFNLFLTFS